MRPSIQDIRRRLRTAMVGASTLAAAVLCLPVALGWAQQAVAVDPQGVVVQEGVTGRDVPDVDRELSDVNAPPEVGDPGVVEAPIRANMVGVSVEGDAEHLYMRARGADDEWSRWIEIPFPEGEGPDERTAEARRAADNAEQGERQSLPVWVGDATHLQVARRDGEVDEADVSYINTTGTATTSDRVLTSLRTTAADALGAASEPDAVGQPGRPSIIRRAGWGADESIRRAGPSYAPKLKAAAIHHTVGTNSYSCSQSKAIVRGIYEYHVNSNEWNDIGYNFLVDRCGKIFEGRFGGIGRPVIGAHAVGFNTGSTGVAFMGTHSSAAPSSAAVRSLKRLLSWRLDVDHVHPTAKTTLKSQSSQSKFPLGSNARLHGVFGHRDVFATDCPGGSSYTKLGGIRSSVWRMGGPKIARPRQQLSTAADGTVDRLRVLADGNRSMTWELRIERAQGGELVRRVVRNGTRFDFTWNGTGKFGREFAWDLRWRLMARTANSVARPAARRVSSVPPPLDLTYRGRRPWTFSPNGDGYDDRVGIEFSSNVAATLTVTLVRPGGTTATIRDGVEVRPGRRSIKWGGKVGKARQPMGTYRIRIDGIDARGKTDTFTSKSFALDRTLRVGKVRSSFSPNGDGRLETMPLSVGIQGVSPYVRIVLRRNGGRFHEVLHNGPATNQDFEWVLGKRSPSGAAMPDGRYTFSVRATSSLKDKWIHRRSQVFVRDTSKPKLRKVVRVGDRRLTTCASESGKLKGLMRRNGRTRARVVPLSRGCHRTNRLPGVRKVVAIDRAKNRRPYRVEVRRR